MYYDFGGSLGNLPLAKHRKSRAINAENPKGEKGKGGMASSDLGPSRKGSPCLRDILSGQTVTLAEIDGPGTINHIWITVDSKTTEADCFVLRDLVLRMYWDDEEEPSVESPLGDFFCCGFGRECNVNSMPIAVVPSRGLNCYFQMPFRKKAKITLENQHANPIPAFFYQVDYCLHDEELPEDIAYFHAQWRREKITQLQRDYVILDDVKGKGHYVGTYMALTTLERYWWGEGEIKFYIDGDIEYPTICGTGTEDYFGGSWSFAKQVNGKTVEQNYCTPYLGYPYYSSHDEMIHNLYHNDDWLNQFGNIIMMQKPEDMELFPPEEKGFSYLMLFDDYNKIDLTLLPLEELDNYLKGDKLIKVLIDKDCRIKRDIVPTDIDYHVRKPSAREYDDCCNEFWNVTPYVIKGLCRKEILFAIDHFNGLS